jgi:ADP-ribose pyrophosphatase
VPGIGLVGSRGIYRHERFLLDEERFSTPAGEVVRPAIHHPGAVAVIARPAADRLVLVRQYRYPLRRWLWEIPAGTLRPGEAPAAAAARELAEETGYRAGRWRELLAFHPAVGVSDELMHLFTAEDLVSGAPCPDPGELIEARTWTAVEVAGLEADRLDAKTLVALAWLGWWPAAGTGTA